MSALGNMTGMEEPNISGDVDIPSQDAFGSRIESMPDAQVGAAHDAMISSGTSNHFTAKEWNDLAHAFSQFHAMNAGNNTQAGQGKIDSGQFGSGGGIQKIGSLVSTIAELA